MNTVIIWKQKNKVPLRIMTMKRDNQVWKFHILKSPKNDEMSLQERI